MAIVEIQPYDPNSLTPPAEVVTVMEAGLVQVTRRAEFYEADAVTRWYPDANDPTAERLIDGNVNVDYGSEERRKLDIVFNNIDKLMRPNPDGGFWYDKVIKVYRGVTYDPRDIPPHVAIIEAEGNDPLVGASYATAFSRAGFRDNDVLLGEADPSDLKDYSWIVSARKWGATDMAGTLNALFDTGKNIVTFGTGNGAAQVPHYTTFNNLTNLLKTGQQNANDLTAANGWVAAPWGGSVSSLDTINPISGGTSVRTDITSAPTSSLGRTSIDTTATGAFASPANGTVVYGGLTVRNDGNFARQFRLISETRDGTNTIVQTGTYATKTIQPGTVDRLFGSFTVSVTTGVRTSFFLTEDSAAIGDAWTIDDAWVVATNPGDPTAGIAPITGDSPTAGVFTSESVGPGPGPMPTAVAAGVQRLAVWTNAPSPQFITAALFRNGKGAVWLDIRLPNLDGPQTRLFLKAILNYVRNYYGERTWESQLGEFYIDNISEANFPNQLKVTCRDATKKLMNDKLSRNASFVVGTSLEDFVTGQAALAGIPVSKMRFNMNNESLTTELSFDKGTSRWEMIKGALDSFNYEYFFDAQGNFVVRPFNDPTLSPIDFTFKTGPEGNLVTFEKAINDSRIYNIVQVTAVPSDNADIPIAYFGEARNDDPNSPTNTTRLGNRVYTVDAPWLSTDEACASLAKAYLKISALESYELNFSSIFYSWLEAGSIIEIIDPDAYSFEPTRFLMDTIDYGLGLDPMSATGKRVTFVGAAN